MPGTGDCAERSPSRRFKDYNHGMEMKLLIQCQDCGKQYRVTSQAARRELTCLACGNVMKIGSASTLQTLPWKQPIFYGATAAVAMVAFLAGALTRSSPTPEPPLLTSGQQGNQAILDTASDVSAAPLSATSPVTSAAAVLSKNSSDSQRVDSKPTPAYVAKLQIPDESIDRKVDWGSNDPDWSIPVKDESGVWFSADPSRFVLVDDELFDLTTGLRKCSLPANAQQKSRIISPAGTFIATHFGADSRSVPEILVYATANPNAAPVSLPNYSSREELSLMLFLNETRLLGCCGSHGECKYVIWDVTNGREISSFKAQAVDGPACLSPDGRHFAVADNDKVMVYDLEQGREVTRMSNQWRGREFRLYGCTGLRFSPDGSELAATYSSGSRLAVWSLHGELRLFALLPTKPIFSEYENRSGSPNEGVQWLPDGRGWLVYGTHLVLRKNSLLVWQLGGNERIFSKRRCVRLIDQNHVVTTRSTGNGNDVAVIPIPWAKIEAAIVATEPASSALVTQGRRVKLAVAAQTTSPENQQAVVDQLKTAVRYRLASNGISESANEPTMLKINYTETIGEDLKLKSNTGVVTSIPKTDVKVIIDWIHDGETLWTYVVRPSGPGSFYAEDVNQKKLRDEAFGQVLEILDVLNFPTRICRDEKLRLPLQTGLRDRRGTAEPWQIRPEDPDALRFPIFPGFSSVSSNGLPPEEFIVDSGTSISMAAATPIGSTPTTTSDSDSRFVLDAIPVPDFPDLGPEVHRFETGEMVYHVSLNHESNGPGTFMKMHVYLPAGPPLPQSLGCVLIAAGGTDFIVGYDLNEEDHAEALLYARAGMVVVRYSVDGNYGKESRSDKNRIESYTKFKAACAGMVNARNAFELVLRKLPQVDPKKIVCAGYGTAATLAMLFAEHEPRLAGCVAFAPGTNLEQLLRPLLIEQPLRQTFPDLQEFVKRSSPHYHVKHIRCPLVIFGAYDNRIEPSFAAAALVKELQLTNTQVTLEIQQFGGFYPSMIEYGIPAAIAWLGEIQGIDIKTEVPSESPPMEMPTERTDSSAKESAVLPIPDGASILRLEVTKYVGKNDMETEARRALKDVNWLIAETACVEKVTGNIVIGMQGNTVNTGQLKRVLGEVGLEIGHISVTMGRSK